MNPRPPIPPMYARWLTIRRQLRPSSGFALLCVAALLFGSGGCLAPRPSVVRGKELRRSVQDLNTENLFDVALAVGPSACVRLQVFKYDRVRCREFVYYEKTLEYQNDGERDPSRIRHVPVPNEEIEVKGEERVEVRKRKPMNNHAITVNGVTAMVGVDGIYSDTDQRLLRLLDANAADNAEVTILVVHQTRGTQKLTATRRQILESMGISQDIPKACSDEGLVLTTAMQPESPKPGESVAITLVAANQGPLPAGRIEGRIFSRCDWLTGANFYIGTLAPGAKRAFTRTFTVPAAPAALGPVFAEIGIWTASAREKLGDTASSGVPIHLRIQAAVPPSH